MPCPYWDEWAVVSGLVAGNRPWSWGWMWSQHGEHRIALVRLLVAIDYFGFGARSISLTVELFAVQLLHWTVIAYAIQRTPSLPPYLKRILQGVFAFCLFHPNQLENFIWAFQVGFILCFAFGSAAVLAIAFYERWTRPVWYVAFAGLAPILAATNLSGGLLIGLVVVALAIAKRIPRRVVALLVALFTLESLLYLYDYQKLDPTVSPLTWFAHPKEILVYVLTYFGASWTNLLPHKERTMALVGIVAFVWLGARAWRIGARPLSLEWFLYASGVLMLLVSFVTALGRLQSGVGQAFAGRYQTPAMVFWACLASLILIAVRRHNQSESNLLRPYWL